MTTAGEAWMVIVFSTDASQIVGKLDVVESAGEIRVSMEERMATYSLVDKRLQRP